MSLQTLREYFKQKMSPNYNKNACINYSELVKRKWFIDELRNNGLILIPKRTYKGLGYSLIVLGALTLFIPFTTIPLVLLGCYMLGLSPYKVKERLRKAIKRKRGDFY